MLDDPSVALGRRADLRPVIVDLQTVAVDGCDCKRRQVDVVAAVAIVHELSETAATTVRQLRAELDDIHGRVATGEGAQAVSGPESSKTLRRGAQKHGLDDRSSGTLHENE